MLANYAFIPKANSSNRKLGAMSYTYAPPINCDPECPLKNAGCYAENPPIVWQWVNHQSGKSKASCTYPQMLTSIRRLPHDDKVRLFVAGDFPRNGTGGADCSKATEIAQNSRGKKVIVYSHHQPWSGNGAWGATVRNLRTTGFNINISCESEQQVDAYIADGISCVITVPSTETRRQWRTASGNRVRICPNQIDKAITCEMCMLCHQRPDDMAIAFKAHGSRVKTVNSTLEAIA
jgi:hypothetical protein